MANYNRISFPVPQPKVETVRGTEADFAAALARIQPTVVPAVIKAEELAWLGRDKPRAKHVAMVNNRRGRKPPKVEIVYDDGEEASGDAIARAVGHAVGKKSPRAGTHGDLQKRKG